MCRHEPPSTSRPSSLAAIGERANLGFKSLLPGETAAFDIIAGDLEASLGGFLFLEVGVGGCGGGYVAARRSSCRSTGLKSYRRSRRCTRLGVKPNRSGGTLR